MKTVLCYGDSNTWGAEPQPARGQGGRFGPGVRWPGVLRTRLGPGWHVVEEGLNGRTTCVDDPVEGARKNGATFLPVALESHHPLDLLIVMLGTNDLKARLSMQAGDIADGMEVLAGIAQRSTFGPGGRPPRVLLVSPPPLATLGWLAEMFEGGEAKSRRVAPALAEAAHRCGADYFDAGTVIASSTVDGIHLDAAAHARLGEAMVEVVRGLVG